MLPDHWTTRDNAIEYPVWAVYAWHVAGCVAWLTIGWGARVPDRGPHSHTVLEALASGFPFAVMLLGPPALVILYGLCLPTKRSGCCASGCGWPALVLGSWLLAKFMAF